jgi:hypothetical protein
MSLPLIVVCAKCVRAAGQSCSGACPCPDDGQEIRQHAAEGFCPRGKYGLGLGDTIARFTYATGIQAAVGPCGGCKDRQKKLNRKKKAKRFSHSP